MMKHGCWPTETTFYHSGDLGDIIYGLLFASTFGDISLSLGPDPTVQVRSPMTPEVFRWLRPLLAAQPWIKRIGFHLHRPAADYNLNEFRRTWFSAHSGCRMKRRLFETYAEHFGHEPLPEDVAWLTAPPLVVPNKPVVIARSDRYQNPHFPWRQVSATYAGRMLFVGFESEWKTWVKHFGKTCNFYPVHDALEMARLIAGAQLFIGNQSFPMALALALNVPLIQEVCPNTPDCVFNRPNATYVRANSINLPPVAPRRRYVTRKPNARGEVELGPRADAYGLGDTLTVTAAAAAIPKAVMCLPHYLKHQAAFFDGLCPVRITDDFPVFPFVGGQLAIAQQLASLGINNPGALPVMRLSSPELEAARGLVAPYGNAIALCPTTSATWSHVRGRPPAFWTPIVEQLRDRFKVLQFGNEDFPDLPGCVRMPFLGLRELAAVYAVIGRIVSLNTGDFHLMLAVGGRAIVIDPPQPAEGYDPVVWRYRRPDRVHFVEWDQPKYIEAAITLL